MNYIFGPVASRRLGRSLGIDPVPLKTCTLDCVCCECGSTTTKTVERKEYVPLKTIIAELSEWKNNGGQADYVTLAGSGEPALHSRLGEIITEARRISGVPVCLLTNATLFYLPDVRAEAALADVVVPSLDAADPETFQRVNRPHQACTLERHLDGLLAFSREFTGELWLEIFLVPGYNDSPNSIAALAAFAARLHPAKIQLNTAVRPPAERSVGMIPEDRLRDIAMHFSPPAELIASYRHSTGPAHAGTREKIITLLSRRPGTINDIAAGLDMNENDVLSLLDALIREGIIITEPHHGETYYVGAAQKRAT